MSRMKVEMPGPFDEPTAIQSVPGYEPGAPETAGLEAFGITTMDGIRTTAVDPPSTERQRRFMGAELARKRAGKKTRTGMRESQLREFARRVRS